jgi:hypothetical protein
MRKTAKPAKKSKGICRHCRHWGLGLSETEHTSVRWAWCEIVAERFDMPVREWVFDPESGRQRWVQTGEAIPGEGGGKRYKSLAEYSCNHFADNGKGGARPLRAD